MIMSFHSLLLTLHLVLLFVLRYIVVELNHFLFVQNAAEKPPRFLPSWTAMYVLNAFVVVWVLVVGFGFGGWASMTNFIRQVDTFGLFAKCYQCKPPVPVKH